MEPGEGESRDMMSSSVQISALELSQGDSVRPEQHLDTDEVSSCPEFGASDLKYLLYEDEQDFKVRFRSKQF